MLQDEFTRPNYGTGAGASRLSTAEQRGETLVNITVDVLGVVGRPDDIFRYPLGPEQTASSTTT